MLTFRRAWILALLLVLPTLARAQDSPAVHAGDKVRIRYLEPGYLSGRELMVTGRVQGIENGHLVLMGANEAPGMRIENERISQLAIYQEEAPAVRPWGVGLGFLSSIALGWSQGSDPPGQMFGMSKEVKIMLWSCLLVPMGAIADHSRAREAHWHSVPLEDLQVGIGSTPRGQPGLLFSWKF